MTNGPSIEVGGVTDVGRHRDHNEDTWAIFPLGPPDDGRAPLACVVADGMGGHRAGEVASALAVETIEQELGARYAADPDEAPRSAVELANRAIWQEARDDPARAGMGTTVVCAVFDGPRARLSSVGDSPAFLTRGGQTRQITRDHSWVAEQVAAGALSPEDARVHPYRGVLTRALGIDASVQVDLYEPLELQAGDVVVLCSDGLTEHVLPEEIGPILADAPDAEAAARALVDLANARGGLDNTTVVVARLTA